MAQMGLNELHNRIWEILDNELYVENTEDGFAVAYYGKSEALKEIIKVIKELNNG